MYNKEIAETILKQIGGNEALLMLGTKHVSCDDNSLIISKIKGCKLYNTIVIKLNSLDLYDITLSKNTLTKKYEFKVTNIKEIKGIYNDMLVETLERNLNLFLNHTIRISF